jgi:hypothetical protein
MSKSFAFNTVTTGFPVVGSRRPSIAAAVRPGTCAGFVAALRFLKRRD